MKSLAMEQRGKGGGSSSLWGVLGKTSKKLYKLSKRALKHGKKLVQQNVRDSIRQAIMDAVGCDSCTIVVMGKTGVGKSTLINSLLSEVTAEAARGVHAVTKEPSCFRTMIEGLQFNIWDTPGLFDRDGAGEQYVKQMKERIGEFHLVLLVIEVSDSARFKYDDELVMKMVHKEFGDGIFNNMVVVFTKANLLLDRCKADVRHGKVEEGTDFHNTHRDLLEGLTQEWKRCLHERIGVSAEVPMLPAGEIHFKKKNPLPIGRHYPNWYGQLWKTCLMKSRDEAALTFIELARRQGRLKKSSKTGQQEDVSKTTVSFTAGTQSVSAGPASASSVTRSNLATTTTRTASPSTSRSPTALATASGSTTTSATGVANATASSSTPVVQPGSAGILPSQQDRPAQTRKPPPPVAPKPSRPRSMSTGHRPMVQQVPSEKVQVEPRKKVPGQRVVSNTIWELQKRFSVDPTDATQPVPRHRRALTAPAESQQAPQCHSDEKESTSSSTTSSGHLPGVTGSPRHTSQDTIAELEPHCFVAEEVAATSAHPVDGHPPGEEHPLGDEHPLPSVSERRAQLMMRMEQIKKEREETARSLVEAGATGVEGNAFRLDSSGNKIPVASAGPTTGYIHGIFGTMNYLMGASPTPADSPAIDQCAEGDDCNSDSAQSSDDEDDDDVETTATGPEVEAPDGVIERVAKKLEKCGDWLKSKDWAVVRFFGRAIKGGGEALQGLVRSAFQS